MFVNAFIGSGANSISILFCFCGNKIFHINHKNFIVLIMYYICYKGDATEKIGINDIKLGVKEWIKKYKKFYPLFNTKSNKKERTCDSALTFVRVCFFDVWLKNIVFVWQYILIQLCNKNESWTW